MAADVIVPTGLWEEDVEAVITTWLARDGATVGEGDLIAEIMVEKVQHEIRAPATGALSITKKADEIVTKGTVIGQIS